MVVFCGCRIDGSRDEPSPKVALTLPLDFEDASITRCIIGLRRMSISSCSDNTILHITTPGGEGNDWTKMKGIEFTIEIEMK